MIFKSQNNIHYTTSGFIDSFKFSTRMHLGSKYKNLFRNQFQKETVMAQRVQISKLNMLCAILGVSAEDEFALEACVEVLQRRPADAKTLFGPDSGFGNPENLRGRLRKVCITRRKGEKYRRNIALASWLRFQIGAMPDLRGVEKSIVDLTRLLRTLEG